MKRITTVLLTLLLLSAFLVLPVSANGPAPYPTFTVYLTNYPPEARYMDVLVRLSPEDADYTDNRDNFPNDTWASSQIFSYEEDGYMSYTFHYRGAQCYIRISKSGRVEFFANSEEKLQRFQSIKIAVLDEQGNILQISEPFDPDPSALMAMNLGYANYDYEADTVEVPNHSNVELSLMVLGIYILLAILGVAVTVFVEWLIAHCFTPLILYLKVVLLTNLVTQLTMRILFVLLYSFLWQNYWFWTLLLEVAVYTAEYFTYRKYILTAPKKTILTYVIVANTVTLLLGIAVNNFLYL